MSIYTDFNRDLMKTTHAEIKAKFPTIHPMRDAWVYKLGRGRFEFHGPDSFYWHGRADDAYHARAIGWSAWAKNQRVELDGAETEPNP